MTITASVGIAVGDRISPSELLRDADIALYNAKAAGKDRYSLFLPEMHTVLQDRLTMEADLSGALERHEFFLVYQPIFELGTGAISGVEALLRWRHPTRGVLEPESFVPVLESSGRIVAVGRWVLEEACGRGRQAIDDFGAGYSSLAYLRQFPVDALKIDRSSISAIVDSPEAAALIHTLVQLGKTLGLETLAEGIEDEAQDAKLQAEECDRGQGFLVAGPLDVAGLERFPDRQLSPGHTEIATAPV